MRRSGWRCSCGLALVLAAGSWPARGEAPGAAAPFVVALDAGHGGSNLGAVSAPSDDAASVIEKRVTLEIARLVRDRLGDAPALRVVLCRDRDTLVPIRARARCAADAHAQLFVSLHANATPPDVPAGSRRGFELYVLSPDEIEEDATLAALGAPSGPAGAWAAHLVRAAGERALHAARAIERHLAQALGARLARGIRQSGAARDVLRGTGAPAVLVEVGFIDHPQEGPALASATGQDRIAAALADAIRDIAAAQ